MSQPFAVTVIGAASTTFGPKLMRDAVNFSAFEGAEFRLVDVAADRLEIYRRLFERVAAKAGRKVTIRATTDRREALAGSKYVIISVDRGHYHTWRQDFTIPNSLGARQVMGELGGPGGIFHSLRQVPLHLAFARDIAELCPQAMVMVCSNPLNRICQAMRDIGGLTNVVGLCHGCEMAIYLFMPRFMEIPGDDMEITAVGTNHLTWMLGLHHKHTGEDLYPLFRQKVARLEPNQMPMCRKLMDIYGWFPATLDGHAGEYLAFAHEFCGLKGFPFDDSLQAEHNRWEYMRTLADDNAVWESYERRYGDQLKLSRELRLDDFFAVRSWADTLAGPVIQGIEGPQRTRMPAINLPNTGQIANLPAGLFVETPCFVDGTGLYPLAMGALPAPLAAFCRRDLDVCTATVDAVRAGTRNAILAAAVLDPTCDSIRNTEAIIDKMLEVQAEYFKDTFRG
ncbi:MAG: hypothetical protein GX591_04230 [Planctomycetes bacterium]|nr:hypothetical protein [Planctomycetota bacterium]